MLQIKLLPLYVGGNGVIQQMGPQKTKFNKTRLNQEPLLHCFQEYDCIPGQDTGTIQN